MRNIGGSANDSKERHNNVEPPLNRIICRCEEVSLQELTYTLGSSPVAISLPELKRRTRAGMGICQGRTCGPLLSSLLASSGADENAGPALKANFPARPILLANLAARADAESGDQA